MANSYSMTQQALRYGKLNLLGSGVAYAAMLDTGNFMLASQVSTLLWQSFDYPTDTMLPSQTMSQGSKLVARYSEMNYSNGRFQFQLRLNGSIVPTPGIILMLIIGQKNLLAAALRWSLTSLAL